MGEKVSPHFYLSELVRTDVRWLDNVPGPDEVANLTRLCEVLEALRDEFGPLRIHSAFRSEEVNRVIGGSKTSAHVYGCAADLTMIDLLDEDHDGDVDKDDVSPGVARMVRWLRFHREIEVDQVIDEKGAGPGWLHVGIAKPGHAARREFLTYRPHRIPQYQPFPT